MKRNTVHRAASHIENDASHGAVCPNLPFRRFQSQIRLRRCYGYEAFECFISASRNGVENEATCPPRHAGNAQLELAPAIPSSNAGARCHFFAVLQAGGAITAAERRYINLHRNKSNLVLPPLNRRPAP